MILAPQGARMRFTQPTQHHFALKCVTDSQIDDEADVYGIDFVKISDSTVAKEHGVYSTPALVYFRKKMPVA